MVKTIVYSAAFLFVLVIEYLNYLFDMLKDRIDYPITSPCIKEPLRSKM